MSEIFFTADTPFGHRCIISMGGRPFSDVAEIDEEMDEEMIQRWNDVLRKGDTVYHLGDFAMGATT